MMVVFIVIFIFELASILFILLSLLFPNMSSLILVDNQFSVIKTNSYPHHYE